MYPLLEDMTEEAGMQELETYVSRRHNTVTQFIVTRPIMDLCMAAWQRPEPLVSKWWWEHDVLAMERMRTAAQEAEQGRGYGRGGDGYRLSRWEDNVANLTLGTEPNALLAYAPGLEHHHPIMSTIGNPGVRLLTERE